MTARTKKPQAETAGAYLVLRNSRPQRATWHQFKEARRVDLGADGIAWEMVYKCTETGAERRWGTLDMEVN